MKASGKNTNWLPIWLFAIVWCFFNFMGSSAAKAASHPALGSTEKYLLESSFHKEYPVALPSSDTPQIVAQSRNAEEKGKNPFKYFLTGTSAGLSAIIVYVSHHFLFLYTHFFKYLFILYCVLLI